MKTSSSLATEFLKNIKKPKSNDQNNTKNTKNITKQPCVPILGPKPGKNLKRKTLNPYSHQELI